ncbi:hypothetical protein ID866_2003 [Astraeus odoratus]|nr:hypothetical protein ID866_2003 [Astraeus odoratus]
MAASGALPGLFLCFSAMVLLIFVSVSAPTWNSISFMDVGDLSFGVFGYTGSKAHVGYSFPLSVPGTNSGVLHNLTYALILYPIAAGLAGISVLFGLCGAAYHRAGTVFMSLTAALALLCTLVVWVISTTLFGIERAKLRDYGIDATWGNATWIGLGALVALLLGFCTAACGVFGSYRRNRRYGTY